MKRLISALLLLVASVATGQQIPSIGKVIKNSPEYSILVDGCAIGFNKKDDKIFCIGFDLISISIPASSFGTGTLNPPTIFADIPAYADFIKNPSSVQSITVDWIMPSQEIEAKTLLLSWTSGENGQIVWFIKTCAYNEGEPPCIPQNIDVRSHQTVTDVRNDYLLDISAQSWAENQHVIIEVGRDYSNAEDNLTVSGKLDTIRLELQRARH